MASSFSTRALLQKLGVELPIIQAPMAGSQGSALALAVAETGALGSLPAAQLTPDALRRALDELKRARAPINLNFFSHTLPAPDPAREAAWREALAPYYAEYGITEAPSGPGRVPFSHDIADVVLPYSPRVVSFHFGLPEASLLERVRQSGAVILSTATTLAEGLWLQERGVDAVIAQGLEAGGHRGHFLSRDLTEQLGVFSLVQQLVANLRIPVIAAGGIRDSAGVAAALRLGAAAVQVGSAYLLCPEATTSEVHRAALQSPAAAHTALTNLFSGRPARGIVNRLMRELGPLSELAPEFPAATSALIPLRAAAEKQHRGDFSPLWAGQNAFGLKPQTAAALTKSLSEGVL